MPWTALKLLLFVNIWLLAVFGVEAYLARSASDSREHPQLDIEKNEKYLKILLSMKNQIRGREGFINILAS